MKNIELFPADRNEKKQADIVDIVETAMFFFYKHVQIQCFVLFWYDSLA